MTKILLSLLKVVHGVNDVMVHGWIVVVLNNLTFLPFVVGEVELVSNNFFSSRKRRFCIIDVCISSEMWHKVINLIASILLLMLVLGAASRVANRIRQRLKIGIELQIDMTLRLDLLLIVEGGASCSDWCLWNGNFFSFVID